MALLYWNKKSLQDQAIIWFGDSNKENITIEQNDKYTLIKEKEQIVGINIRNASSFLTLKEGAQSLTKENIDSIETNLELNISSLNTSSMFIVGEILERKPHPKSEKLFLLKVKTDREISIVTNTTNSLEGKKIVIAKLGAILPSGTIIKPAKIMGINSEGTLCGGATLGLEETEGAFIVKDMDAGQEFII